MDFSRVQIGVCCNLILGPQSRKAPFKYNRFNFPSVRCHQLGFLKDRIDFQSHTNFSYQMSPKIFHLAVICFCGTILHFLERKASNKGLQCFISKRSGVKPQSQKREGLDRNIVTTRALQWREFQVKYKWEWNGTHVNQIEAICSQVKQINKWRKDSFHKISGETASSS